MIAHKFSLLRQLCWAATLATGFGTALVCARHSGSAPRFKRHGRAGSGLRGEELVVRSDGTPLIQQLPRLEDLSLVDLSRPGTAVPRTLRSDEDQSRRVHLAGEPRTPGSFTSRAGLGAEAQVVL